ncbi:metallophosphoesterase [Bosea sp. BIWAKO-01]|uniref:metallophosphoesterase family protein n=1 Tax=Bosea sp. BIWAKO-01 TaxID=506668 RepID=UPI000868461A|nr:metallophosphoesterase [Bosea sp. BIWAKO-01]GAU82935.1 hypothetical protein BIWAKO_02858 [Bosea sp. BIWAKO-01]
MAEWPADGSGTPIVTLQTLKEARPSMEGLEGGRRNEDLDVYDNLVETLAAEAEKVGAGVLFTAQNREASRLQSAMAERCTKGRQLEAGGLEAKFGEGVWGGDWLGWLRSLMDHVNKDDWCDIKRPAGSGVALMPDKARVAVLSDWGTGLYGAPASAASIRRQGGYDLLLHLGDIYYSGTQYEANDRFLRVWPTDAGKISRALNGNHEMYSGGFAYFDDILPAFGQEASYFAFRNEHWLLVGLDTAHTDHNVDDKQAAWLNSLVRDAGGRKIVLSSHHQPFSRLDEQGPKLQTALSDLLQSKAIAAWYWGHEHDCVIYDRHPSFGLLGRCVGNGGIPSPRKSTVTSAETERASHGVEWKRLRGNAAAPACLVLDGPNPLVKGEEHKFVPHGYLTLDFDGPTLIERMRLPDGTEIYRNVVR